MTTLVLGSGGMAGSAILSKIPGAIGATRVNANLADISQTMLLFKKVKPQRVFLAAAKVGGLVSNSEKPVDFITENILIQTNVMKAAHEYDVERLMFLGSSCIYPVHTEQPMRENQLMTGVLEKTNSAYAMAKLCGIESIKAYRTQYHKKWISVLPCNLYGPGDNYTDSGHFVAGLIKRIVEAKLTKQDTVEIWGTGKPRREIMHVSDFADACIFLMDSYNGAAPVNIGTGEDKTIFEYAKIIADIVDYKGKFCFNLSVPDGTPQKLLDITKLKGMGWVNQIKLKQGLELAIQDYITNVRATNNRKSKSKNRTK